MEPVRRFIVVLVMISVFLTGGRVTGQQVVICTEPDGQVHIEAPSDGCCPGEAGAEFESGDGERGVVPASAISGCGPCSDELVTLRTGQVASERGAKLLLTPDFAGPVGVVGTAFLPTGVLATGEDRVQPGHAFPSVRTVVLRC